MGLIVGAPVDLSQEIQLLCPDFRDGVCQFGRLGCSQDTGVSADPICLVCHFLCLVVVQSLVDLGICQVLHPLPDVV